MDRIEVAAGRCRDMRLFQHLFSEIEAVIGEFRHICIEIEGAVGRQEVREAGLRQSCGQDAAVLLIAMLDVFHLRMTVEGSFGRDLRQRRHRDRQVLLQPFHRPYQRLRYNHPANAPAGHAEVFRERVDHHRMWRQLRGRHGRKRIVEAVIDLVGDEPDAFAFRSRDQGRTPDKRHHGAGGIGRARDQHALQRFFAMRGE